MYCYIYLKITFISTITFVSLVYTIEENKKKYFYIFKVLKHLKIKIFLMQKQATKQLIQKITWYIYNYKLL